MTEYELLMSIATILNKPFRQVAQTPYITLLREMTETYADNVERLIGVIESERNGE